MGRGRRREARTHTDRILQRKVKNSRRKSVAFVKAELDNKLKLSFQSQQFVVDCMKSVYMDVSLVKKPYVNKINR